MNSPLSQVIEPGLTTYPYLATELRDNDARGYRAAGVLAFAHRNGETYVLLGSELRKGSDQPQLTFLAGKREPSDRDAEYTAAREMWEESGSLMDRSTLYMALRTAPNRQVLWANQGKMAIYLLDASNLVPFNLPETYGKLSERPEFSEMVNLHWIKTADLAKSIREQRPIVYGLPIYSFAFDVLKLPQLSSWLPESSLEASLSSLSLE